MEYLKHINGKPFRVITIKISNTKFGQGEEYVTKEINGTMYDAQVDNYDYAVPGRV